MKKKFILGIGSQRAGSTLMSRLLDQSPEIALHPLKELHYFDTLFGVRHESALKDFSRAQLMREVNRLCDVRDANFLNRRWQWYMKSNLELFSKPVTDINYFDDLFKPSFLPEQTQFIGESTPEYMLLDRQKISQVKDIIGEDAYIILICRNPVKRFISAFRLLIEYGRHNPDSDQLDDLLLDLLTAKHQWTENQIRYNNYREAKQNYESLFKQVLVLSYDDFIIDRQSVIQETSDFLGIHFDEDVINIFNQKVNSLKLKYSPNEKVSSKLEHLFHPACQDANEFLGRSLIH